MQSKKPFRKSYYKKQAKKSIPFLMRLGVDHLRAKEQVNTVINNTSNAGADVVSTFSIQCATNALGIKLNGYAAYFQEYKINWMKFTFEPVLNTSTYGACALGWTADPDYTNPTTYEQVAGNAFSKSGTMYEHISLVIGKPRKWLKVYILAKDLRFSVDGNITFATTATSAAQFPGFLWMEYDVSFRGQIQQ